MSVSILNQPAFLPQLYLVRHLATVIRYAPVHHHQSPTSAFLLQEYLGACLPHGAVVSYAGILTTLDLVCHRGSVVRYATEYFTSFILEEFSGT